ncbi:MAG: hypothetical protein LBE91_04275 [Tannerella sp.]|jgi:hypothetical protein|nr:hypothetical protein [Tannerella sp.]
MITQTPFGKTPQDEDIYLFRLQQANGQYIEVSNCGAARISCAVPARNGVLGDVLPGYPALAGYLFDACDRLEILVIDEAFDVWNISHYEGDYGAHFDRLWRSDLESMVLRNHPSVIMWSIGNEIKNTQTDSVARLCGEMAEFVKSMDDTRPVTAAVNAITDEKSPSRASILTGRSPVSTMTTRFAAPLDKSIITYPEYLIKEAGYYAGLCGCLRHQDEPEAKEDFIRQIHNPDSLTLPYHYPDTKGVREDLATDRTYTDIKDGILKELILWMIQERDYLPLPVDLLG